MFIYNTCIKLLDNVDYVLNELNKIGIKPHPSGSGKFIKNGSTIYVNRGFYSIIPIGYTEELNNLIDCDTNIDLFLAIAAIRDDSDYMQWFIYDNSAWADIDEIEYVYIKCQLNSIQDFMCLNSMWNDCTKATVEQLIKYFKK